MKRSSPLGRDVDKVRAWVQRSRAASGRAKRPQAPERAPSRTPARSKVCWLREHGVMDDGRPVPDCDGRLVRCHLLPQQFLRREFEALGLDVQRLCADPRSWVWGCGGPAGNGGHHGMLDHSRTLKVPFERLPSGTVEMATELGVIWWLEREYGPRTNEALGGGSAEGLEGGRHAGG